MLRLLTIALFAMAASACAFGDAKLSVAYDASTAKKGVLSEAPPATVYVAAVDDKRLDKQRIGYKRNTYGMKTADILSVRPPPEVVKAALETILKANNHLLGDENNRFALETTLTNFWFDGKSGFFTVEFYGSVQAELTLVDKTSGEKIYSEQFDGYYSEKTGGGLNKTCERIMNAALADLVNKVNLSPGFADALKKVAAEEAAPAGASADATGS